MAALACGLAEDMFASLLYAVMMHAGPGKGPIKIDGVQHSQQGGLPELPGAGL